MAAVMPGRHVAGLTRVMNSNPGEVVMSKFRKIALVPAVLAIILVAQTAAALIIVGG